MDSNTKPTGAGVLERKSRAITPKPELVLDGQRFSLTGQLQKAGRNGSTHLTLRNFGVTIGGKHQHDEPLTPLPSGYREIAVSSEAIAANRPGTTVSVEGIIPESDLATMHPNTCLVLREGDKTALAILKQNGTLRFIPKPPKEGAAVGQINPRNFRQALAFGLLMDSTIPLVALPSVAGTGKTLMALRAGLEVIGKMRSLLRTAGTHENESPEVRERPNRIIVCRSPYSVGKDLGFLPGTLEEKISPWANAVHDALAVLVGAKECGDLFKTNTVEVITYEHLRGRSLHGAVLIGDDFQNADINEALTFLTRAGNGTKVIITGDPMQVDNKAIPVGEDGMTQVVQKFIGWKGFGTITLVECLRSELAAEAARRLV
ncbi:MAG: PhoH family protein [bacterium]|nr:PhoH family protein [bacterium]